MEMTGVQSDEADLTFHFFLFRDGASRNKQQGKEEDSFYHRVKLERIMHFIGGNPNNAKF